MEREEGVHKGRRWLHGAERTSSSASALLGRAAKLGSQLVAQVVDGEEEDIVAGLRRRGDNGRRRGNGRGNCCEEPHLKQRPPVQPADLLQR